MDGWKEGMNQSYEWMSVAQRTALAHIILSET